MKRPIASMFFAGALAACTPDIPSQLELPANQTAATGSASAPALPISLNVLMVKFVDQAADPVWEAAVTPPKTDADWEQVEYHATQLATSGAAMQLVGTGPRDAEWVHQPSWIELAQRHTQAALAAVAAAQAKDVRAIERAGDEMVLTCEACHRQFKPDLPTEGLATHLTRGIIIKE